MTDKTVVVGPKEAGQQGLIYTKEITIQVGKLKGLKITNQEQEKMKRSPAEKLGDLEAGRQPPPRKTLIGKRSRRESGGIC